MNIEGTYTLEASSRDVWNYLMDQRVLQTAIQGVGVEHVPTLEAADEDSYDIALHVGLTPLAGLYRGKVTVTERHYPSFYRLTFEGEGGEHTVKGEGSVSLHERGDHTIVDYEGTLHLSTLGEPLPAPVVKGAAKLLLQQFFTSLAEQLAAAGGSLTVAVKPDRGKIVLLGRPRRGGEGLPRPALLGTVVRRLGLGAGNPVAEAQWADRIKRVGILLGLLLLVWIGSRVPRK